MILSLPGEGVECPKLMPAETQLLLSVPNEPTDVCSDKRDPELVELQHADDGVLQVVPVREVVPQPVRHPLT